MPEENIADHIEDHVGLTQPDAFEEANSRDSVTTRHRFSDGGQGSEKEATLFSHHAGASSEAPAGSGIPSAEKQHGVKGEAYDPQVETAMPGHVQDTRAESKP